MPDARVLALLRTTRALTTPPTDGVSDADLLARFLDRGDAAAFEALVRRHGPMVRAVCRAALPNPADADDAFQATFLILVRRAAVIRDRGAIGGWLYRVAYRAAGKLRRTSRATGPLPADLPAPEPAGEPFDVRRAVEEEVGRLPEKYRLPVQLCYVAGQTTAEAARHLGWARGTVLTRLAWARKRLRKQLSGRGIAPAVGAVAALIGRQAAGGIGPELVSSTVRAAVVLAARGGLAGLVTNQTITTTEGVLRTMALNNLKWVAGVLLVAVALTGIGVNHWAATTVSAAGPPDKKRGTTPAAPTDDPLVVSDPLPPPTARVEPPPAEKSKTPPLSVGKPTGTWTREVDTETKISLTIDEDRIYATAEFTEGGEKVSVTIDGDYSINKESVLFGVITGIDCTLGTPGMSRMYVGQPFAFGFRTDGDLLWVKDVRFATLGKPDGAFQLDAVLDAIAGRYVVDKTNPHPQRPKPAKSATPRARRLQGPLPSANIPTPTPDTAPSVIGVPANIPTPIPDAALPTLTPPPPPQVGVGQVPPQTSRQGTVRTSEGHPPATGVGPVPLPTSGLPPAPVPLTPETSPVPSSDLKKEPQSSVPAIPPQEKNPDSHATRNVPALPTPISDKKEDSPSSVPPILGQAPKTERPSSIPTLPPSNANPELGSPRSAPPIPGSKSDSPPGEPR
ncbi:RNA polymerase sigma factor [Fimbriiglobus ruber]|uniref:High-affnity carbon uptake protein Hat/HatR n=1 Tax=Fimbriiglobus ruber TaxID=1908690 RepID=A0A225DQ83_9BACT|nr:RNA polymerase sigma factor [Fimbriiglobus ruber]OWK43441.1 High-affnity carbon uptake protein Hat/HatR [Fimbriiglobus ruber]